MTDANSGTEQFYSREDFGMHAWVALKPCSITGVGLWRCLGCHAQISDSTLKNNTWHITAGPTCPEWALSLTELYDQEEEGPEHGTREHRIRIGIASYLLRAANRIIGYAAILLKPGNKVAP